MVLTGRPVLCVAPCLFIHTAERITLVTDYEYHSIKSLDHCRGGVMISGRVEWERRLRGVSGPLQAT
jgi:hypothetical protein